MYTVEIKINNTWIKANYYNEYRQAHVAAFTAISKGSEARIIKN